MAAKVPAPKMQIRAIFSLVERLRIPSVLIGKAKIQMSVTMLIPEVALYSESADLYLRGMGRRLTIEICSCVNAEARQCSCQIPHFFQW